VVAGGFVTAEARAEFNRRLAEPSLANTVEYLGFVSGEQKNQLLREADLFCFPTYYENENQPVNLIEAMAFGLPILATHWRSLPELFPANYLGLVNVRAPEQVADRLLALMTVETGEEFRQIFLRNFTLVRHLSAMAEAITRVEAPPHATFPAAAIRSLPR
jgi:glycosyltransferase involved in cell wall biosynthesis